MKHLAEASTGATKGRRLEDEKMDGKKTRSRIRGNVDFCDVFFCTLDGVVKKFCLISYVK